MQNEISQEHECFHENLYLLALERTGWRRWLYGRWVYSCEPFRNDIARKCIKNDVKIMRHPWERFVGEQDG